MTTQQIPHGKRQRSWWIPWLFVALFGVVLAANGIMLYIAMSSFTGLQTEGHYRKGLEYNRVLDAARAQDALGWTVSTSFEPAGDGGGKLVARATDRDGAPLTGARATARLLRPTQSGYDVDVTLDPRGDGVYDTNIRLPLTGQWEVRIRIGHDANVYRIAERIMVR